MSGEEYYIDFDSFYEEMLRPLINKRIVARTLDESIKGRIKEIAEFTAKIILDDIDEDLKVEKAINIFLIPYIKFGIEDWEKERGIGIVNRINNRGEKVTLYWFIFREVLEELARNEIEYCYGPVKVFGEYLLKKKGEIKFPEWTISQEEIPYLFLKQFYKLEALVDPERDPDAGEDLEEFESWIDLRELEFKTLGLSEWVFNTEENIPLFLADTLKRWGNGLFKDEDEKEIAEETDMILYGIATLEGYGACSVSNGDIKRVDILKDNKYHLDFAHEKWIACRKDKINELLKLFRKELNEI
ncbi:MAG: hypothetical protein N2380_00850 [bacterium]|nr:hypothetical protein [bacterium]